MSTYARPRASILPRRLATAPPPHWHQAFILTRGIRR